MRIDDAKLVLKTFRTCRRIKIQDLAGDDEMTLTRAVTMRMNNDVKMCVKSILPNAKPLEVKSRSRRLLIN